MNARIGIALSFSRAMPSLRDNLFYRYAHPCECIRFIVGRWGAAKSTARTLRVPARHLLALWCMREGEPDFRNKVPTTTENQSYLRGVVEPNELALAYTLTRFEAVMPYDVRSISNYVLDIADREDRTVSNLSMNKVVFFLHSYYLLEFRRPLVSAKIEAWDYGPVFRELYREFKSFGDRPIRGRAYRINPESGEREICKYELSREDESFLEPVVSRYVRFSASTLVTMSHVSGGPWDQVWNHGTKGKASMRISDEMILACHQAAARH